MLHPNGAPAGRGAAGARRSTHLRSWTMGAPMNRPRGDRRRARLAARGGDLQALQHPRVAAGPGRAHGGPRRGDRPLVEQLPRPRRPSGRRRAPGSRGSSATAPAPRRCASSAARSSRISSSSATRRVLRRRSARSRTSRAGTRTRRRSRRSPTSDTVIVSDELNHASIIDAMRLAKPERKVRYAHSDMARAARRARSRASRGSGS